MTFCFIFDKSNHRARKVLTMGVRKIHPLEIQTANLILDAIPAEIGWTVEGVWPNETRDRMTVRTHQIGDYGEINVWVFIDVSLPDLLQRISPHLRFKPADLDGFTAYTITTSGVVHDSLVGAIELPPEGITRAPAALHGILSSLWDVLSSTEPIRRALIDPYGLGSLAIEQAYQALGIT
jgi:hypothetical protein